MNLRQTVELRAQPKEDVVDVDLEQGVISVVPTDFVRDTPMRADDRAIIWTSRETQSSGLHPHEHGKSFSCSRSTVLVCESARSKAGAQAATYGSDHEQISKGFAPTDR